MPSSIRSRLSLGQPVQMASGLLLFGIAGYVFVALTGHTLSESEANLAIAFYFLVNVIGPGVFAALEQLVSRATSGALAAGQPIGPALRRARRAGAGLVVVVVGAVVLLSPILVGSTLHGDWVLFVEVLTAPVIAAAMHLVRGLLAGARRFGPYAGTLAVEGTARLLLCSALALGGTTEAWIYGLVYQVASLVAVLAGVLWLRGGPHVAGADTAAAHPPVLKSLTALTLASLFAQFLPNIAPLVVTSRMAVDSAIALAFGQAAVVARIPLLLFFPVQTVLLPSFTAAVTRGEQALVARRVRLLLIGITAAGALAAVLFVVLGPWVLRTFLGSTADLTVTIMTLLAASTVVLLAASATQPALVALGRDHVVTLGWAIGSAVTLGLALLPADPPTMGAVGQLAGPGLTLLVVLLGLRIGLRSPVTHLPRPAEATR